jgi:hypothetical protein
MATEQQEQQKRLEEIAKLIKLSERLYAEWDSDAAFYTLKAAALSCHVYGDMGRQIFERCRQIAVYRRDEYKTAELEVTAANHGVETLDVRKPGTQPGYRHTYAELVEDIDRYLLDAPGTSYEHRVA